MTVIRITCVQASWLESLRLSGDADSTASPSRPPTGTKASSKRRNDLPFQPRVVTLPTASSPQSSSLLDAMTASISGAAEAAAPKDGALTESSFFRPNTAKVPPLSVMLCSRLVTLRQFNGDGADADSGAC